MAFQLLQFKSSITAENTCFISVSNQHIRFSTDFVLKAKITSEHKVLIRFDNDTFQIAFEFTKDQAKDCLKLTRPKGKNNFQISAATLYKNITWFKSVASLSGKERRFNPTKDGALWIINLCPAFENAIEKKDINKLSSSMMGIYRYKNIKNEIVYIGKGKIKTRFNSPERKDWEFNLVEYSEIQDENIQYKWESYWLDKFSIDNGRLPIYNAIGGKKMKKN